ncbi:MAG TPA: hypothetical protein DD706_08865, partial [Nitrospiraceae bacterium]|nr:hypothetical protein [Nitrospiraceae bacterium]
MPQNRKLPVILLGLIIGGMLTFLAPDPSPARQDQETEEEKSWRLNIEELLDQFQFQAGLTRLDEAIQLFPASPRLHKKRGNVLMILRQNQEALTSYRQALTLAPDWLPAHWALWALLDRLNSNPDLELDSLFHIAELDSRNPLAQIRVARKLRQLQRFEESVVYFRRAVKIAPTHLAYRLFLARALYDVLSKEEAKAEVQWVLSHASPDSPEWVAARNLSQIVGGESTDKGARSDFFKTTKEPYGEEGKDYKTWALTREKAWQLMETGEYAKAEAMLRTVLTLDPEDDQTRYNLGLTLFKLKKNEEAIASLKASLAKSGQPAFYPDAIFQIGRAYAKLGNWEQALDYFQQVWAIRNWQEQDFYALNFPDLHRVEIALEEARTHVPTIPQSPMLGEAPSLHRSAPSKSAEVPLTPSSPDSPQGLLEKKEIPLRVLPLSVDVVRGWFRQLITAKSVIQDERQAGFHEYIPLDPGDTFSPNQPRIYLVFALTTPPGHAKKITTQWVGEGVEGLSPNTVVGTDSVLVDLNDNSGYFFLDQPQEGWSAGTYRIDLFVGEDVSGSTYVAEVRFRIQS